MPATCTLQDFQPATCHLQDSLPATCTLQDFQPATCHLQDFQPATCTAVCIDLANLVAVLYWFMCVPMYKVHVCIGSALTPVMLAKPTDCVHREGS